MPSVLVDLEACSYAASDHPYYGIARAYYQLTLFLEYRQFQVSEHIT